MHGFGGNIDSLRCLADRMCRHYTVTLVEFFGHGDSPHPNRPLCLDDFVESLAALVRHYQMKSVTLVAHSFGGRVALKFARCNGHLLDRLVLISAAGLRPRRGIKYYSKIFFFKLKKRLRLSTKNLGSSDYKSLKTDAERATFVSVVNTFFDTALPYITAPTLLLWGKNDKATPMYMAKRFEKNLYDAYLKVLGGGHFFYADCPQTVAEIITAFLN